MIPESYRKQNGCYNCGHCFVKYAYDASDSYYCHFDKSNRPLCRSVAMDEATYLIVDDEIKSDAIEAWDSWAEQHSVNGYGKCDNWSQR